MILITGATGTVGREVVRLLAQRGRPVRAMSRTPSRIAVPGVDAVRGDFAEPASLARAAAGATALFLLTAPARPVADDDLAMLEVARREGVAKVVKLSAIGGGVIEDRDGVTGGWHLPGERAARDSGMAWTVLRPTTFASNTLSWADAIRAGAPVANPTGAGRQGVIDPRDIAEVACAALTSAEHDGQVYTLTGPELISAAEQAAQIGSALGRTIEMVDLSPERFRQQLLESGADPQVADLMARGTRLVREGGNAVVTEDVQHVLGRPPRTFAVWAADHRAQFE